MERDVLLHHGADIKNIGHREDGIDWRETVFGGKVGHVNPTVIRWNLARVLQRLELQLEVREWVGEVFYVSI